ncbi:glycoside hydrolase family 28 protein [Streptomyces sp. Li-HN-5-11]|uniref:glycoside hydrolase family 28 protein n=1 Tax=Streptomyces sp. Li-HN-5-11 TaxID=3075432 RepID=UPI0028A89934|nr:glycoside hydrolase family 28 protein [Streptomyces sp. Li-HN-5-11]WNM31465.1 glycoside hydrolase family 28 protein [Streptomyces sp. Li-HN-5-11]
MTEPTRRQLLRSAIALGGAVTVSAVLGGPAFGSPLPYCAATAADRAADRIVAGIRRPAIPRRDVPVTRFGAVADGTTDNTAALAAAVEAAHRAGGGRVVVPAGRWATGPIHLLSRVELHLEAGATLLFSTDPAAYLPTVYSRWQGIELMNYSPLIYAYGQHDIAVTGAGVLDGQASTANWWAWKPLGDADFATFEATVNAGLPVAQRDGTKYHFRPAFVEPYDCRRVLVEGVTFKNSPFWFLHPTLCQDVTVHGVTVEASGPNTDGCDPESCDGVLIDSVSFDTGDDCVAVKAGRNTDGRRVNTPSRNIVIQNSTFASGHGGITIGSEMTGGVRDVYARDLTMTSTGLQSGHRLKTNSVRGGYIESTHVYRVDVTALGGPLLLIDYNYGEGDTGTYPPTVTDVNLSHWSVTSATQGWNIQGYADDPVGTVRLSDITIDSALTQADIATNVTDLRLTNVVIDGVPQ